MKKKALLAITAFIVSVVVATTLVACNYNPAPNNNMENDKTPAATTLSTSEVIAFSAASSANVLSKFYGASGVILGNGEDADTSEEAVAEEEQNNTEATDTVNNPASAEPTPEEIAQINEQISMLESFIGNNPMNVQEVESDRPEYSKKMIIETTNLSGEKTSYILYLNETLLVEEEEGAETETEEEETTNETEETEPTAPQNAAEEIPVEQVNPDTAASNETVTQEPEIDIEAEQEFALTGIMIVGDQEFRVEGEKELEVDEYEFSLRAFLDDLNYVEFKQEIETEGNEKEEEFYYAVYTNGQLTSEFSLEIEEEEGEQKIEMSNHDSAKGLIVKYEKKVEGTQTYIKAQIVANGTLTEMKIYTEETETGELIYRYKFSNGNESIQERD